jgi:hypothetical protein
MIARGGPTFDSWSDALEAFIFRLKHRLVERVSLVMTAFGHGCASPKAFFDHDWAIT